MHPTNLTDIWITFSISSSTYAVKMLEVSNWETHALAYWRPETTSGSLPPTPKRCAKCITNAFCFWEKADFCLTRRIAHGVPQWGTARWKGFAYETARVRQFLFLHRETPVLWLWGARLRSTTKSIGSSNEGRLRLGTCFFKHKQALLAMGTSFKKRLQLPERLVGPSVFWCSGS